MADTVSPLYFAVAGVGIGLVFSAVRNDSPLALLRSVLTGGGIERRRISQPFGGATGTPINAQGGAAVGGLVGPPAPLGPAGVVPELERIGQGNHQLTPTAAAAFRAWQQAYGAPIIISDSYRPYEIQLSQHLKDPDRFADPRRSPAMHSRGLAVDVDLGATTGGQSRLGQPRYDRLYQTAMLSRFLNYERGLRGHTWHFSYGVAA